MNLSLELLARQFRTDVAISVRDSDSSICIHFKMPGIILSPEGKQALSDGDGVSAMWPLLLKQPTHWATTHKTRRQMKRKPGTDWILEVNKKIVSAQAGSIVECPTPRVAHYHCPLCLTSSQLSNNAKCRVELGFNNYCILS